MGILKKYKDEVEVGGIELERQLENIRKEQREMKEAEHKRLVKEFINANYEKRYSISFEVVMSALFGTDFMKREVDRYREVSEYLEN